MNPQLLVARAGEIVVPLPAYQTAGSAGLDLCAALAEEVSLVPGERRLIATGLKFEIPPGFEGQVRPRSGLALRHGLTVLNSPGTIDSDYRGEVGVVLINHGLEAVGIKPMQRIAQLVIAAVVQMKIAEVTEISSTPRGTGGYGSTGA